MYPHCIQTVNPGFIGFGLMPVRDRLMLWMDGWIMGWMDGWTDASDAADRPPADHRLSIYIDSYGLTFPRLGIPLLHIGSFMTRY